MNYLESDITFFDPQLFFYFRNKYKPEIIQYLNEKHYFESENKLDYTIKKNNLFIWNGILVREIVNIGFTYEHLADHYNGNYKRILLADSLEKLQVLEIQIFSRYIDIIIHEQEFTDHLLVNRILHYLYLHIEDDISLKDVVANINTSQSYASRVFKTVMGTSIIKYSKQLKIERAKSLLKTSESITAIGEKLGFYDQAHFSKTFKAFTGESPQSYRIRENH